MVLDIILPILTISGIAIGAGIMLSEFGKADYDKFDERQLIEQGRGADIAMRTSLLYLLGLYVGDDLDLIHSEYIAIFAVYGLLVSAMVYHGYCIFNDAFLRRGQRPGREALRHGSVGAAWLVMALYGGTREPDYAWIRGALSLASLSVAVMLLMRELMLRVQDRRAEKDGTDG